MKIKFVKEPTSAGMGYFAGDVLDTKNEELAKALIDDGYAVAVNDQSVKTDNVLPDRKKLV